MKPTRNLLKQNPRIAAATAMVIVAAFLVALSALTWRTEYSRQARYLETLANMGERSLDTFFLQLRSAMAFLGEEVAEHHELDQPHAAFHRLTEFRARFPALSVVALVRADGQLIATTWARPGTSLPSIAGAPDFTQSLEEFADGRNFTISRPVVGRITGEWQVSPRWAIRDADGKLRYMLAGALPLTNTQGFWAGSPVPEGVTLGIIRDDGYLLVRHPTPPNIPLDALYGKPRSGELIAHLRERGFPRTGLIEANSSSLGERNLVAYRRFGNFPLTFRVSVPLSEIHATWWLNIFPLYALTAAMLAALVAIYLWQSRLKDAWAAERERQLDALAAANRDLTRANEELDSFSYTVAHDLRAPVRALDGFAGLLGEGHGDRLDPEGRALLARIRDAAARMGGLIDGMLTFARFSREAIQRKPVDTAAMVSTVAAELLPAGSPCRIVVGELPPCQADPVMLRVVWTNLISNAIKFSRHKPAPQVEIGCDAEGYFVRDNGAGFDMAHTRNLFGAFHRLHSPADFEGTGIGLAIVKRVVERHGGRVWARGEVGNGAEFRFTLGSTMPASQASAG